MPQNPVNYNRMARLEAAENPEPSEWFAMNNATKFCFAVMFISALILYRRWIVKRQSVSLRPPA